MTRGCSATPRTRTARAVAVAATLAALLALGGCTLHVHLMPTPTLFVAGDGPAAFDDRGTAGEPARIDVLYATNRLPVGRRDLRHYSRVRADELQLGVATMQVGDGTKTWEHLRTLSTIEQPGERPKISLVATRELAMLEPGVEPTDDARAFFAQVDERLARSATRNLLVYTHGARTDFARAAAQAAQLQHFLGRDAVVVLFAWPSAGTLLRYGRDVATARNSEAAFAQLLEQLSRHTQVAHVDVLAYSAGAMIASPGLARAVGDAVASEPARVRLGEIYYAAPDIDFPVFVANLQRYEGRARRVTVALNVGDRALSFAQWRHRVSRAGRPNLAEIGPEETAWLVEASRRDEVDVLSVGPEDLPGLPPGSHAFWYDHPWVSSDILLMLRFQAAPPARGLRPDRNDVDVAFWRFPPDYAERLPAIVRALRDAS